MQTSTAIDRAHRQLLTVKQVAERLNLNWRTVLRLADAGKFPCGVKLGAARRWDASEIDAFIAGGCKAPHQPRKGVRS